MRNHTTKKQTNSPCTDAKSAENFSEKQKRENTSYALASSVSQAIRELGYICYITNPISPTLTLDKYRTTLNIQNDSEVDLSRWVKADKFQRGMILNLALQVNVARDKSNDLAFPFTVRPLQRNETFFNASDEALANKFTDQFTKELKQRLGILRPEYYYVITGRGAKRHIHGSVRLPAAFHDLNKATATREAYQALKRACGLTDRLEKTIAREDKRSKLYKFAISSLNTTGGIHQVYARANKPYGLMADFGDPLRADIGQLHWSQYILTGSNKSGNKIRATRELFGDARLINDELSRKLTELRSCPDWSDNAPRFDRTIEVWKETLKDIILPKGERDSDPPDCLSKTTSLASESHSEALKSIQMDTCSSQIHTAAQSEIESNEPDVESASEKRKAIVLEKKRLEEGGTEKARNANLKIREEQDKECLSKQPECPGNFGTREVNSRRKLRSLRRKASEVFNRPEVALLLDGSTQEKKYAEDEIEQMVRDL